MTRFKGQIMGALGAAVLLAGGAPAFAAGDPIAAAVAASDRPAADTARDANRKPAELVAFAGIKPGQTVADILPGGGYFTRIFSSVAGDKGKVYGVLPAGMLERVPAAGDGIKAMAATPGHGNVALVATTLDEAISVPTLVDVAWTSDNFHDIYNGNPENAAKFAAAMFKIVKPGGVLMVIDHAAAAGTTAEGGRSLHRVDPGAVKTVVTAAGFKFEGESKALANPDDDHTLGVRDPKVQGKTDQFVLKFRKPK